MVITLINIWRIYIMNNYLNELVANVANSWEYRIDCELDSAVYYNNLSELIDYCKENEIEFPFEEIIDACEEIYSDEILFREISTEYIELALINDIESIDGCASF